MKLILLLLCTLLYCNAINNKLPNNNGAALVESDEKIIPLYSPTVIDSLLEIIIMTANQIKNGVTFSDVKLLKDDDQMIKTLFDKKKLGKRESIELEIGFTKYGDAVGPSKGQDVADYGGDLGGLIGIKSSGLNANFDSVIGAGASVLLSVALNVFIKLFARQMAKKLQLSYFQGLIQKVHPLKQSQSTLQMEYDDYGWDVKYDRTYSCQITSEKEMEKHFKYIDELQNIDEKCFNAAKAELYSYVFAIYHIHSSNAQFPSEGILYEAIEYYNKNKHFGGLRATFGSSIFCTLEAIVCAKEKNVLQKYKKGEFEKDMYGANIGTQHDMCQATKCKSGYVFSRQVANAIINGFARLLAEKLIKNSRKEAKLPQCPAQEKPKPKVAEKKSSKTNAAETKISVQAFLKKHETASFRKARARNVAAKKQTNKKKKKKPVHKGRAYYRNSVWRSVFGLKKKK